jgi:hypothetical protein
VLLLVLGLASAGYAVQAHVGRARFIERAVAVDAVVVEERSFQHEPGARVEQVPVFAGLVDGVERRFEGSSEAGFSRGERATVYVDRADVSHTLIDCFVERWADVVLAGGVGFVLLVLGAVLFFVRW